MKKDKFKKMRLQIQTLDTVGGKETCVLLLDRLQMELDAKGIRSDDKATKHLRTGKQAEDSVYGKKTGVSFCEREKGRFDRPGQRVVAGLVSRMKIEERMVQL